jgi:type II secretory pathway pseudopilin PulG
MSDRSLERPAEAGRDRGATMLELVLVLALLVGLSAMSVPMTAAAIDAGRARQAGSFVSSRFRQARHQAIFGGASVGIVFDLVDEKWTFRVCGDGNGNGIRRAELGGPDVCHEGPYTIDAFVSSVAIAVDPSIRGPGGEPGSPDPVRFGRSDLISFSSNGSCTPGSLYLRSPDGVQYAIRVAGVTGRTRLLRYDAAAARWTEP